MEDVILPSKPGASPIVFRTAQAICQDAPAMPEVIVGPYVFAGAATKIDGLPKGGKRRSETT